MKRLLGWNSSRLTALLITLVLLLVPFQAFLTVWGSSLVGHYTALRLWDDTVLVLLIAAACVQLARNAETRAWFTGSLLVRLIAVYCGLTVLLGAVSYAKGEVTPKALAYGILVNLRFLLWFLAVLLSAQRSAWLRRAWPKLLLLPAAAAVLFALLQYSVLPHNFLSHFGYNAATTIAPIETINHNSRYIRVQSTLRGANPLGAYLVVVLSSLAVLFFYTKRKIACVLFGATALAALYASGSRSAWIGTVLSLCAVAWLRLRTKQSRLLFGSIALVMLLVAGGAYGVFRNSPRLQNEVLHTQTDSAVKSTSDGAHASALKSGLSDVLHQPLGDGPGTAGPASQYNGVHPPRIAENYYVQIAQEVGWLGLALFLSIMALVARELYERVNVSSLALAALASFVGIAFVNLLSHAWADDTLAFVWWGLAGMALARRPGK